jgi:hypothetical protein
MTAKGRDQMEGLIVFIKRVHFSGYCPDGSRADGVAKMSESVPKEVGDTVMWCMGISANRN